MVLRDGEFDETVLSEVKGLGREGHSPPRKDRGGVQVRSQFCFWAVGGLPNLTVYRLPIYDFYYKVKWVGRRLAVLVDQYCLFDFEK
jgi:hypothetical protein